MIAMPSVKRRDWFQIIYIDLGRAGVSQSDVARACDCAPRTIGNWIQGGEPRDTEARIILSMYRKCCREKYEEHIALFPL